MILQLDLVNLTLVMLMTIRQSVPIPTMMMSQSFNPKLWE